MEPIAYNSYVLLSILVITWCVIHSAMISMTVTEYLKKRLGHGFRFYRLLYNLIAILTFIPVVLFTASIQTQAIFRWSGYLKIGQVLLLVISFVLFYSGGRHYNALQFLGIKQIRDGTSNMLISGTGGLDTSGILGITRHPWYLAAIIVIWARQLDISAIVTNILLTSYLIVGTYLEEKKLIREFGDTYKDYQKSVSMLIPYKWIKSKVIT